MATAATDRLTYEEWAARPETNRIEELIDGELVVTPPARAVHQAVVTRLLVHLHANARAQGDFVVPAPFGIRAGERTVVEPDVVYFLGDRVDFDQQQHTVTTPPDLVAEVLSPSTRSHDLVRKRRIFEEHGIREAWFVDTDARRVEQVVLDVDGYGTPTIHEPGASVTSAAVPGLAVTVDEILPAAGEAAP